MAKIVLAYQKPKETNQLLQKKMFPDKKHKDMCMHKTFPMLRCNNRF